MFSAHQNILIPNLSCFFHQMNPQIFKSLDYLKMGGQYHSLSLSLHCHLQVWRHEGSVSWPNRALRHEMDWPHRAPDQDLSHMCDVDTRLSCNTGPTSRRKVGLDFLSTTVLNNSVEDYNSSRVGVICRLQFKTSDYFQTLWARGLTFCMVLSYDLYFDKIWPVVTEIFLFQR